MNLFKNYSSPIRLRAKELLRNTFTYTYTNPLFLFVRLSVYLSLLPMFPLVSSLTFYHLRLPFNVFPSSLLFPFIISLFPSMFSFFTSHSLPHLPLPSNVFPLLFHFPLNHLPLVPNVFLLPFSFPSTSPSSLQWFFFSLLFTFIISFFPHLRYRYGRTLNTITKFQSIEQP